MLLPLLRTPAWALFLAAGAVYGGAYFALPVGWQPVANCVLGGVTAVAVGLAARRMPARAAVPWLLVAAWQLLFGLGDLLLPVDHDGSSGVLGFAPTSDLLYLVGYGAAVGGLGLLVVRRVAGGERGSLIDASVAGVAAGVMVWILVVAPSNRTGSGVGDQVLATLYPMLDVFLLACVACLALSGAPRWGSLRLLGAAAALTLAADLVLSYQRINAGFASGTLADLGWLLAYACVGAAALHPTAAGLAERAPHRDARFTAWRRAVLYAGCLVPPVTLAFDYDGTHQHDVVAVAIAGGVTAALVVWRLADFAGLQTRRAEEERGLRFAAAELAGASDQESIAAAALAGAVGLVPDACEIRVNLLEHDELRIAAAAGEGAAAWEGFRAPFGQLAPAVQSALREHRAAELPVDVTLRPLVRVSDRTRVLAVYPLLVQDEELAGWVVVGAPHPLARHVHESLYHLASLASLALERAGLTDEQHHESAESWLAAVIQGSTDVITICEPGGEIRWQSASVGRTLGFEQHELIGSRLSDLLHEDDPPEVCDLLSGDWEPLPDVPVRVRMRSAAGTYRFLDLSFTDLRNDARVRGLVVTARDVTEESVLERLAQGALWAQLRSA